MAFIDAADFVADGLPGVGAAPVLSHFGQRLGATLTTGDTWPPPPGIFSAALFHRRGFFLGATPRMKPFSGRWLCR